MPIASAINCEDVLSFTSIIDFEPIVIYSPGVSIVEQERGKKGHRRSTPHWFLPYQRGRLSINSCQYTEELTE